MNLAKNLSMMQGMFINLIPLLKKNIQLNEISIKIVRKNIKNTHLSVYPPNGRVILVTPKKTRFDVARAYAISKIKWIINNDRWKE